MTKDLKYTPEELITINTLAKHPTLYFICSYANEINDYPKCFIQNENTSLFLFPKYDSEGSPLLEQSYYKLEYNEKTGQYEKTGSTNILLIDIGNILIKNIKTNEEYKNITEYPPTLIKELQTNTIKNNNNFKIIERNHFELFLWKSNHDHNNANPDTSIKIRDIYPDKLTNSIRILLAHDTNNIK